MRTLLNVGCGPFNIEGLINTDKELMDITKQLPYQDETVDGITCMHVINELTWKENLFFFRECLRVLRKDGVLRIGVPHIDSFVPLDALLGWSNIQIFSEELLAKVLLKVGFKEVIKCELGNTKAVHAEIVLADNRPVETLFLDAFKYATN